MDFCNIRGLNSNLYAVQHDLETARPALLFLSETQIARPSDTACLQYPGYKIEHNFMPHAGVAVLPISTVGTCPLSGSVLTRTIVLESTHAFAGPIPGFYIKTSDPLAASPAYTTELFT